MEKAQKDIVDATTEKLNHIRTEIMSKKDELIEWNKKLKGFWSLLDYTVLLLFSS